MTIALKLAAALLIVYAGIVATAYLLQRRLTYFPDPERVPPSAEGLHGVDEITLAAPDGARLIAWYRPAKPGEPTLLYFHGNAGNLATRGVRMGKYLDVGRGMLLVSYRGYGGSTGDPSEAANAADARLAYDWLIGRGVRPADLIVYGESLGSGVASRLATDVPIGGLILDAPFTSAAEVGALRYPFLPVRLLMRDRYDTIARIGQIKAPLLVIHGERDRVVPVEMGRRVFAAAPEPKALLTFPEAGHADHASYGSFDAVQRWIEAWKRARPR